MVQASEKNNCESFNVENHVIMCEYLCIISQVLKCAVRGCYKLLLKFFHFLFHFIHTSLYADVTNNALDELMQNIVAGMNRA